MQPNIALSPAPRLMHDIMPPYARALPTAEQGTVNNQQSVATGQADIPVFQPTQPQDSSPSPMFPTVEEEQATPTPQAVAPVQPQLAKVPSQVSDKPAHTQPSANKINWLIIGLAVLVSAVLLVAALSAFQQN